MPIAHVLRARIQIEGMARDLDAYDQHASHDCGDEIERDQRNVEKRLDLVHPCDAHLLIGR